MSRSRASIGPVAILALAMACISLVSYASPTNKVEPTTQQPNKLPNQAEAGSPDFLKPLDNFFKQQVADLIKAKPDIDRFVWSGDQQIGDQQVASSDQKPLNLPEVSARHHFATGFEGDFPAVIFRDMAVKLGLPYEEIIVKMDKGIIFVVEQYLKLINTGLAIVEQTKVPDVCFLQQVCFFGTRFFAYMKPMIEKCSPEVLEQSSYIKAISRGIMGYSCEESFVCTNPKETKSPTLNNLNVAAALRSQAVNPNVNNIQKY